MHLSSLPDGSLRPSGATAPRSGGDSRIQAVVAAARHHGTDLNASDYPSAAEEAVPSPASLIAWAQAQGLYAKAERVRWQALLQLQGAARPASPIVLLFRDGTAGLMVSSDPARNLIWVRDPLAPAAAPPVATDESRLGALWGGEVLLIRRARAESEAEQDFSFRLLLSLVLNERRSIRSIIVASIALSALTIVPPLLVMAVVDRVLAHQSISTLVLLGVILLIATVYETLLGFSRRELVQVVSSRVDAQLNVHIFSRLLRLPVDFFERTPAGQINDRLAQVWKLRDLLTAW